MATITNPYSSGPFTKSRSSRNTCQLQTSTDIKTSRLQHQIDIEHIPDTGYSPLPSVQLLSEVKTTTRGLLVQEIPEETTSRNLY